MINWLNPHLLSIPMPGNNNLLFITSNYVSCNFKITYKIQ